MDTIATPPNFKIASLVLASAFLALSGCTTHLFSPPARLAPLETSAVLPKGATGVQGEAGGGGGLFGPSLFTGSLRVRRAIVEQVEIVAEGNLLMIDGSHGAPSLRVGVKYAPILHLAFTAGMGGGFSDAGGSVSPDLGAVAAYENPYFVPFLSVRGWLSSPIGARTLVLPTSDSRDTFAEFRPQFSLGVAVSAGFRIPFIREATGLTRASILAGVTFYGLYDREAHASGTILNGAFEYVL